MLYVGCLPSGMEYNHVDSQYGSLVVVVVVRCGVVETSRVIGQLDMRSIALKIYKHDTYYSLHVSYQKPYVNGADGDWHTVL